MNEAGQVCKMIQGNELIWYNKCQSDPALRPFLKVIPEMMDSFRMRFGIDKIDLVMDGVSVTEMAELESTIAAECQDSASVEQMQAAHCKLDAIALIPLVSHFTSEQ